MSFWIYNMGIPIRVTGPQLAQERKVGKIEKQTSTGLNEQQMSDPAGTVAHSQIGGISEYLSRSDNQHQAAIQASQIMSSPVFTLPVDMPFAKASKAFADQPYRHCVVVDKSQKVAGIISDRDILRLVASRSTNYNPALDQRPLSEVMTAPVLTAAASTNIKQVCNVMFSQHIGALPIVSSQGELLGIITRSDILKSMIKNGPLELWI